MIESDLDVKSVENSLANGIVGSRIEHYDTIGSTMDVARELAKEGAQEGTVVIAEEQTKGRGRFNRAWVSPKGLNLSFSVILRPSTSQLIQMNMAATLAVYDAFADTTGATPTIKWPNDVRIRGRKASGILIETSMLSSNVEFAIVGIGVNVNFDPSLYEEIADISTSIYRETGEVYSRTDALRLVLSHFDKHYKRLRGGESLRDEWSSSLDTLGRIVKLAWQDQIVQGVARRVDEQGNLVIEQLDGTEFVATAGEVTSQL